MNVASLLLPLLSIATVLGCLRVLRDARQPRPADAARPASWRTALLVLLQLAAATSLYFTLLPPRQRVAAFPLTVLSADAPTTNARHAVALPEAPAKHIVARVPDLASALRQHAGTTHIEVLGQGLPARDLDAARALDVRFTPAALPRGVVELEAPMWVGAGQAWTVRGRVEGVPAGAVSLHDPSGNEVARVPLAANGRFVLHASSRSSGLAEFSLRLADADNQPVEQIPVPLATVAGDRVRVALLAGGVNAESKYLRRWALDAGLELGTHLSVSPGVALESRPIMLDADALRSWDMLIIDDRAWEAMGTGERAAVVAAVRDGLGLLLRFTTEPDARERSALAPLGFELKRADASRGVRLAALDPDRPNKSADLQTSPKMPELTRRALSADAPDAQRLLQGATGEPLAQWRPLGRGRVGLWWLTDSYRLVLAGYPQRHADLWSHALSRLARARGKPAPRFRPPVGWVGERLTVCGVGDAHVRAPNGETQPLIVDPASDAGCAGYWPLHVGWQWLLDGDAQWPFYVRAADQATALHNAQRRRATELLATRARAFDHTDTTVRSVARWKFFLAWLLIAAALWAFERSRHGIVER